MDQQQGQRQQRRRRDRFPDYGSSTTIGTGSGGTNGGGGGSSSGTAAAAAAQHVVSSLESGTSSSISIREVPVQELRQNAPPPLPLPLPAPLPASYQASHQARHNNRSTSGRIEQQRQQQRFRSNSFSGGLSPPRQVGGSGSTKVSDSTKGSKQVSSSSSRGKSSSRRKLRRKKRRDDGTSTDTGRDGSGSNANNGNSNNSNTGGEYRTQSSGGNGAEVTAGGGIGIGGGGGIGSKGGSGIGTSSSSIRRSMSNLSIILGGSTDNSDAENTDQDNQEAASSAQQRAEMYGMMNSMMGPTSMMGALGERRGCKRFLTLITVAFVLLSLGLQGAREVEDRERGGGEEAGGEAVRGDGAAPISATTTVTNTDEDDGTSSSQSTHQSCGSYLEPLDIMHLRNSSTVSDVPNGAVASDNKMCSMLGMTMMRDRDGNAVDAAVVTALCLGVVNPASSGLGGGAFVMVHADWKDHVEKIGREKYVSPDFVDMRSKKGRQQQQQQQQHDDDFGFEFRDEIVQEEGESKARQHANGGTSTLSNEHTQRRKGRRPKITEFIDARETAPAASTYDMFETLPHSASINGGLAIAVPAELRGLELLHSRHGRLSWQDVVRPAMELARDGFEVSQHLAHDIEHHGRRYGERYPNLAALLTKNGDGKSWYKEGDIFRRPEYADTLREVMMNGANAMYTGRIAELIVRDIKEEGGIVTMEDLANYRPVLRDPLVAHNVGGFTLVGAPPPSSGGAAVIGAARFLTGYNDSIASFADTLTKHRLVEASKHVFSIRMSMSDPAFSNVTHDAARDLTVGAYMDKLREATLDGGVLPLSSYGGVKWSQAKDEDEGGYKEAEDAHEGDRRRRLRLFNYLEDKGTTHLSVVDRDRNAVSITSTVNTYFGSKVVSPSTGIVFNDEMDDFSTPGRPNMFGLPPSKANYIAPGKRPLSSMSPTLVFRRDFDDIIDKNNLGKLFMTLGSSGGPKIITAVLQVFLNHALLGMPLYSAVVNPRIHDQLLYHDSVVTTYDECPLLQGPTIEVADRTKAALLKRGHKLLPVDYLGTTQAVAVDLETDLLTAVSDIRKVGTPAGY